MPDIKIPTGNGNGTHTICKVPQQVVDYITDLLKQNGALYDQNRALMPLAHTALNNVTDTGEKYPAEDLGEGNIMEIKFTMTTAAVNQHRELFGLKPLQLQPSSNLILPHE